MHGWLLHSNPHHSFQPIGHLPMDGYVVENMGRKIFTRTGVSVSFLHTKQVLADRIVIHTAEESDLLYVRVTCHHGEEKEDGYITMFHNEDFTLGYNCDVTHKLLRIPRAATGVSVSLEDETLVDRTKRHNDRFSILARDNNGENILGFLNSRIKNHHDLRNSWLPGTGMPGLLRPRLGKTHWPTILSSCLTVISLVILAIYLIRSKILSKLWTRLTGPHTGSSNSICSGSTHETTTTLLA